MLKKLFVLMFCLCVVFSTLAQSPDENWQALNQKVLELYEQGQYDEATLYAEKVVLVTKKELGENHPYYVTSLNNLGGLYQYMGRYDEAEPLYIQAIEISKTQRSNELPDLATSLNNLAMLYKIMGRYHEAEPLYTQAIEIRKTKLGNDHPEYAISLNNLAELFERMGRYSEAEPLYEHVREIYKKQLGEDHPEYATSLNNLAGLFKSMGRYAEAEFLYTQAKEIYKVQLGENHPYYATSLNNLGGLYRNMGRYEKAEPLFSQAMKIRKEQLGEDNPEYAASLHNLASLYQSTGRNAEAEQLYLKSLYINKMQIGEDHPDYATSLNNLAVLYNSMGRYAEVEPLMLKATEVRNKQLGEDHPSFATSLNNLAGLYQNMGLYAQAEPLYKQAMKIRKAKLGQEHPDYATSLNNLAMLYQNMGLYAQAEPLYKQAMEIRKPKLGQEHPDYAISLYNLAELYEQTFQYDKAAAVFQEIQRISEGLLKRGATERKQAPLNFQASDEIGLKTANTRPFINIYAPDPMQRNERGVNRLNNPNFTIKGFATAAYGIKQLQVNGQKVPVFPDGVWQYPIQLAEGENQILIKAMANSGDETLDTLLLHYENLQVTHSKPPRRFLLSIGINEYKFENWPKLNMPVKDANDLIWTLVEKYNITDVDTLLNQKASFVNVRDRLKHLIGTTRPQDEVIIFFAGHGEYDENFDEDGKWILANGRLGNASLAAVIEKMEAKHVLVLADACFSGSFYLKRGDRSEAAEKRNQQKSRWVVASGSLETVLDQTPGKQNSPFAWHLIDYLQRATGDVTLSALRDHLETEVPKYTDQQPIAGPLKGDEGGELILRQSSN
ncbi:tetratricopeptide repeat protein [Cyclobacterium marinum]|uniref:tetratricopeptide repeat protein n=1 Tax=Cyclobacterium marinum TaxID=104 RepID=UPI0011EDC79A|nr:tetratricopeptide repeat protein [Cyclobacterium marinum]MBI0400295.1 tetratricopeptide repeat protein [Cyclobacterium marinum]